MKLIASFALCVCLATLTPAQNWPSFRGKNSSGIADGQNPPTTWNAEKSDNILWKTPIPGFGHSSPVVWGERVFITTAISSNTASEFVHGLTNTAASASDTSKHAWKVYCMDKRSGKILWERTAYEGPPKVKRHVKASFANSTPATDGKHVVAFFGSEGLYCYDFDGKLLWKQDLGVLDGGWSPAPDMHWGFGSSPIIYKNLVIVQCDAQNTSFMAAYNISDGKRVWHVPRDEDSSWSSPTIYEGKARAELVTSGTKYYRGYDPLTGRELWRLSDGVDVKIPTPIASNDLIFLGGGSSHEKLTFFAVRSGANGDIKPESEADSKSAIAWRSPIIKPHVVTPIVYKGYLYVCTDNGVLTRFDARTGENSYRARIGNRGGAFSASPVAADGRVYFASEDGEVFVIKDGPEYELLSQNSVGEVLMATPAISDGMIIIRGQRHLFGIRESSALKSGSDRLQQ